MEPVAGAPLRRRRRAAVACDHCRLKKLKCDAQIPACQHCLGQGWECVRTALGHKARPTRRRIESLEEDNRRLRALAQSHPDQDPPGHDPSPADTPSLEELEPAEKTPEDGAAHQYHGPTSAIFDLERDQTSHAANCNAKDRYAGSILFAEAARQRHLEQINFASGALDFDGTEPDFAIHLLSIYWSRQLHTGLVVYRPVFTRDMACGGPYFSKLLLNAMYYSASKHSQRPSVRRDPENKATAGWLYRRRFRELLIEEFDKSSITTIQALLIIAVSLFSRCDERGTSWLYAGSAFNMIVDLGLHAGSTGGFPRGLQSGEAEEVGRRVFWGAYVLDKTQSLLQGRPPILRIADAKMSISFLDSYEELEPFESASFAPTWPHVGVPLRYMSNMRSLCELCLIMERVLTNLYGGRFATEDVGTFYNKAVLLQSELEDWHRHYSPLPVSPVTHKIPPLPHQLTIKALYNVLIILLRRPLIIDKDLPSLFDVPQGTDIAYESFTACYKAARDIVSILDLYRQHFPISTSPYLLSYATYISATILVRTPPLAGNAGTDGDRLLKTCLEILDEHCHLYAAARRTKSAIDVLMRHFRSQEEVVSTGPTLAVMQQEREQPEQYQQGMLDNNPPLVPEQTMLHAGTGEMTQAMPSTWPNFLSASEGGLLQDVDRDAVMRSFAMDNTVDDTSIAGLEAMPGLQGGLDLTLGVQHFDLGSFNDLFA